jgi:uncharacterized membrane protein (DUF2068 family)
VRRSRWRQRHQSTADNRTGARMGARAFRGNMTQQESTSNDLRCRAVDARRSHTLLSWIIAFKAVKTILLAALGVTLLFAIRTDPLDLTFKTAEAIHLPVSSRLFDRLATLALHATPKKEAGLAMTAFAYAILMGTEGVGLFLRRSWARWFTIGATGSLIPFEVYEIVHEPHALRVLVLLLNIAVVGYLWKRHEVFE